MNLENYVENGRLSIIVKAGSKKNEILGHDEVRNSLKVGIKAIAQDNKANVEVIKFLSRLTGKKVKIISGLKNKNKVLSLD